MQSIPPKWRRLLEDMAGGPVRRDEPIGRVDFAVQSPAVGLGALLQAYEQLFLERERLRTECALLRREVKQQGGNGAVVSPSLDQAAESEALELMYHLHNSVQSLQETLETLNVEVVRLRNAERAIGIGLSSTTDVGKTTLPISGGDSAVANEAVTALLAHLFNDTPVSEGILDERV